MADIDKQIEEALNAEDRAILDQYGEQGLFGQLGTLFQGKLAWFSVIVMIIGTAVTIFGLYAAWKFATGDELVEMFRWAAIAWAAFVTQIMLKLWSWMRMETGRVLREVKRVELQIALLQSKSAS